MFSIGGVEKDAEKKIASEKLMQDSLLVKAMAKTSEGDGLNFTLGLKSPDEKKEMKQVRLHKIDLKRGGAAKEEMK